MGYRFWVLVVTIQHRGNRVFQRTITFQEDTPELRRDTTIILRREITIEWETLATTPGYPHYQAFLGSRADRAIVEEVVRGEIEVEGYPLADSPR
jgi:hypothetical protein